MMRPSSMWLARAMWPNRILGPCDDVRDILDPEGRAGLGFQDGLLDVVHGAEEPKRPNVHLLHADFYEAAAGIDVVVGELLLHLADTKSIRHQLVRVHAHLILAHRAAEVGNIDHIGNGFELLEENPVFERPQFHQVISWDWCFSACTNRSALWCSSPCRFEAGGSVRSGD